MTNLFMIIDATSKGNFSKLTRHRVPGALPFGAKYRLIDFSLSNCKNSQITNVSIFPYGNYRSLNDHIGSGDRWDLNRRNDGIFILPPKSLNLTVENEISFQRMYEHYEYFLRSNQEYVIVSPASLVWNVDYNIFLHSHLMNKADITEVLSEDNKRLKTYILSKSLLLDYVDNYNQIQFRNLSDVFDYAPNLERHIYKFNASCCLVNSAKELYEANMRMLLKNVRKEWFKQNRPIYSKETMSAPSRYGEEAIVKNSIIASGAFIEGKVYNSIIGRKVHIAKGAKVYNSVIMNQCKIEENAVVEYSVMDKETRVLENSVVDGDIDKLFVSEKKQVVVSDKSLSILQATAECYPYVKTGGLADVVGGLASQLSLQGVQSQVIMPMYPVIKKNYELLLEIVATTKVDFDGLSYRVDLYSLINQNTTYYFVDSYHFFDREKIYGYPDDGERFAFFTKAVVAFLDALNQKPDIIHIHDWHLGLLPCMLKNMNLNIKTLMTIHNIEYQGIYSSNILEKAGITPLIHFVNGKLNFMESGLNNATKITTVSYTYRDELKYEYYSKNLVDIINLRDRDFYGILNGLDDDISPETDLEIENKYTLVNVFEAKSANKLDLQKRTGLEQGEDYFIMGMVTRIVEQKGFDILIPALYEILQNPLVEFVILGVGDEHYHNSLLRLKERFPSRVSLNLSYDATKPNYIYSGADTFLMPSRYEPCGIGQMISMKYGTIPIVRQTGGLNDTVDAYDLSSKRGNGFKFYNYDSRDLLFQITNAHNIFVNHKDDWQQLIINAMHSDFSVADSAKEYIELYKIV
ncbi:MAG: glycogen/starch synthase [Tenericutes bacterium]|nr:glycogen/starch synthase [Mycoplasmatota bacterium]